MIKEIWRSEPLGRGSRTESVKKGFSFAREAERVRIRLRLRRSRGQGCALLDSANFGRRLKRIVLVAVSTTSRPWD